MTTAEPITEAPGDWRNGSSPGALGPRDGRTSNFLVEDWFNEMLDRGEGMTAAAAARKLGVSEATVSRWLSGERQPSIAARLAMRAAVKGLPPFQGSFLEFEAELAKKHRGRIGIADIALRLGYSSRRIVDFRNADVAPTLQLALAAVLADEKPYSEHSSGA